LEGTIPCLVTVVEIQTLFTPRYFLGEIQGVAGAGIVRTRTSASYAPCSLFFYLLEHAPSPPPFFCVSDSYPPPRLNSSTSTHLPPATASELLLPSPPASLHYHLTSTPHSATTANLDQCQENLRPSFALLLRHRLSTQQLTVHPTTSLSVFLTDHSSQDGYDVE
jgi:hypothetical protein